MSESPEDISNNKGTDLVDESNKNNSSSIAGCMANLQSLLGKREAELDAREQEFKLMKTAFEQEYPKIQQRNQSDVLRLNVGGTRMDVQRRTITSIEGSLLASQFSGRWDESLAKDSDGNFFIDQDVELFRVLINYLRDRENSSPVGNSPISPTFPNDDNKLSRFLRMLEYYNLSLGVYPFSAFKVAGSSIVETFKRVCVGQVITNNSGFPETYVLRPAAGSEHQRRISAFEVCIEPGTKALIGWAESFADVMKNIVEQHGKGAGVGYAKGTISLDTSRQGIAYLWRLNASSQPSFLQIQGVNLHENPSIRCGSLGSKWFVNGQLVAEISEVVEDANPGVAQIPSYNVHNYTSCLEPAVTVLNGSVRFSVIEL